MAAVRHNLSSCLQSKKHIDKYLFKVLKSLCSNNLRYFKKDDTEFGQRFVVSFNLLNELVDNVELQVDGIEKVVHHFDLDEKSPGNGFRSCLIVINKCMQRTIKLSKTICLKRDSMLFRRVHYVKELENITSIFGSLYEGCEHIKKLLAWNKKGELFPEDHQTAEDLVFEVECVDQASFYGRSVGFQFCESLQNPVLFLSILMASFCDGYLKSGNMISRAATSVMNATKYIIDPETRSHRIIQLTQNASTDLVKSYWNLAETQFMLHVPAFLSPHLAVNKLFDVPVQCIEMPRLNGLGTTTIPIPRSYVEPAPVPCRLLSYTLREGQLNEAEKKAAGLANIKEAPPSNNLIIHIHGGGFVAMSSKSHEVYLREWAKDLDAPILSIDYTLAPEAPYPRALEECLLSYCWALMNSNKLGTTAERIVFVGDSAGGNLACALALKAIQYGIRKPDGIVCIYTPFVIRAFPSPSRFLSAGDPFLPVGFLLCVITAYAGLEIPAGKIYNFDGTSTELISTTPKSPMSPDDNKKIQSFEDNKVNFSLQFLSSDDDDNSKGTIDEQIASKYDELSDVDRLELDKDLESVHLSPWPKQDDSPESSHSTFDGLSTSNNDYVNKFLDDYVNKQNDERGYKDDDDDDLNSDENVLFEIPSIIPSVRSVPQKVFVTTKNLLKDISEYFMPLKSPEGPMSRKRTVSRPFIDHPSSRGLRRFNNMKTAADPYMSPYFATDDMLSELPPVYLESPHLDPIMDDSVMFAKRLRKLNKEVHIDFFDDVPHAFLNLISLSKEAKDCNKIVMLRLRQALDGCETGVKS